MVAIIVFKLNIDIFANISVIFYWKILMICAVYNGYIYRREIISKYFGICRELSMVDKPICLW